LTKYHLTTTHSASLIPRPFPAVFLTVYVTFEPQGGLDCDVMWTFSNYSNVPCTRMAIDSKQHKTTRLLFQFIAVTQKTCSESGVPSAWYKATVATYNNSTTRRFAPDAFSGLP